MLAYPYWLACLHTTRRTLFGRPTWVNFLNVTRVLVTVMFEDSDEVTPPDFSLIPRVPRAFKHPTNVQVFDEHGVVLVV
jgi:hypothetical protein